MRNLKELISSMEQFYSGMLSVEDSETGYFTIELAVENYTSEFRFYVAIHDTKKSLFEKQILSIFHDAKIVERKDDFNIFSPDGVTVASILTQKKDPVWPITTYESFDYDPLNIILNSFSKIKENGEGAAIQIVIRPNGEVHTNRFKKILKDLEKGEKVGDAISNNTAGVQKIFGFINKAINSVTETREDKDKREEKTKERSMKVDEITKKEFEKKISSISSEVNIRLVVSAQDKDSANSILRDIKSAFNQFNSTTGNVLEFRDVEERKVGPVCHDFSYRLFDDRHTMVLNIHELTSVFHFPSSHMRSAPHVKVAKSGSSPAPLNIAKSGILLGINKDRNTETKIYFSPEDRLRHFYVIGQTGTGKTTLLKNMIVQDIENGEGVCMIDPHGTDIQDVLASIPPSRKDDVIYFDPSSLDRPMGLNMLEYDIEHPEQKTFVVNELFSIFQKLYGAVPESMGPMFEQYFRNSTMLVIDDPESGSTLLDVSRVMANKSFRDLKISRCKNPIIVQFWKEIAEKAGGESSLANIVPYITSKFDVFLANEIMRPIVAQEKSSFDFRKIMDEKKILLVNLSKGKLGELNANLIGLIIVGKILMAALSRVDLVGKDMNPFYLYIDEFQNVTTNSISTILAEARKYKLGLNIAHQFIKQIDEKILNAVFGNVGSVCAFRVGSEDGEVLEKQFTPVFSAKDLMNLDNRNAYLRMLANGQPVKPFNIETLPPKKFDPKKVELYKQLSFMTYGRPRKEVEEEILSRYKKEEKPRIF
jgi:predicted ribonuclease YlaK